MGVVDLGEDGYEPRCFFEDELLGWEFDVYVKCGF